MTLYTASYDIMVKPIKPMNSIRMHLVSKITRLTALLFTLCLGHGMSLQAYGQNEGRWYQVEILIFKQNNANYDDEIWRRDLQLFYPSDSQFLGKTLPNTTHQLGGHNYVLRKSEDYKVLFHKAWIQQMWGKNQSPSIIIRGGENYTNHRELEGTIKIHIGRYLHVTTDLWLSDYPPIPFNNAALNDESSINEGGLNLPNVNDLSTSIDQSSVWPTLPPLPNSDNNERTTIFDKDDQPRVITLRETRSMRSKETHYIDHPAMGLLVRMLPVDAPTIPAE